MSQLIQILSFDHRLIGLFVEEDSQKHKLT